jgi:hypothetical protein
MRRDRSILVPLIGEFVFGICRVFYDPLAAFFVNFALVSLTVIRAHMLSPFH